MSERITPIIPDWPAPVGVRAACSTRLGGISLGHYAALNLGRSSGDDPLAVAENRRRFAAHLALPGEPAWLQQVHGLRVVEAPLAEALPAADAAWTAQRDVVCVAQAADCLPVLFCARDASCVAAAHAGWRGLAGGVLEATVRALPVPASNLLAWLGPAIGPTAFEVGDEVRAAFVAHDPQAAAGFVAGAAPGKWLADLYALARQRLASVGVTAVHGGGLCTHGDPARFFSFRRDGACGRMAAMIWLA